MAEFNADTLAAIEKDLDAAYESLSGRDRAIATLTAELDDANKRIAELTDPNLQAALDRIVQKAAALTPTPTPAPTRDQPAA